MNTIRFRLSAVAGRLHPALPFLLAVAALVAAACNNSGGGSAY